MKNFIFFVLILIGFVSAGQHAPARLSGVVVDRSTQEVIIQARVVVLKDSVKVKAVITDFDGKFDITDIPAGLYSVRVLYFGYRDLIMNSIRLSPGDHKPLRLEIQPNSQQLAVVEVVGEAPMIQEGRTQSSAMISHETIRTSRARQEDLAFAPIPTGTPYDLEDRELYNRNEVSGFLSTALSPLSTFAMDVDRASYFNTRRMIESSYEIPQDAVRTEEFINAFKYEYGQPEGNGVFNIQSELSACPWNEEHRILRIGLNTSTIQTQELPPANLVFLVDVSGSMSGQHRLGLVQEALMLLTDQLRKEDRISLVTYAGRSSLALSSTSGSRKDAIKSAIRSLSASGSTNGAGGIHQAYRQAVDHFIDGGSNRVILCTDGDFNVGISSQSELIRMIEEKRETGVFLSVVGVGQGNYQEGTMEQLANKGNGNFNYMNNLYEARKVFVEEFTSTLFTVAKDAKVQVEFNPLHVSSYRLLGYENRALADEDFDNDEVDGGEVGSGHQVTMLYEIVPGEADKDKELRYQHSVSTNMTSEIATVSIRYKLPDEDESSLFEHHVGTENERPSDDQKFSTAVAAFAGLLRKDENIDMELEDMIRLASDGKGRDENGDRSDFIQLMQLYRDLYAVND